MDIEEVIVMTVQQNWLCSEDNCDGHMLYTGNASLSHPPSYQHRCDKCGHTAYSKTRYPCLAYRPLKPQEASGQQVDR